MANPVVEALVKEHLPLLEKVVSQERLKLRVTDPNILDEMRSCARVGLMAALERYDEDRRDSFKGYVRLRMRYAIYDGLSALGWFPRRLRRQVAFLRRANEMLRYQAENPPPRDKTEAVFRLSNQLKDLAAAYVATYAEDTLDSASVPPEAEEAVAQRQLAARIRTCVAALPEKQRLVVSAYFYEDVRLPQIAERMGVTTSWVSKLLTAGLKSLRAMFESSMGVGESAWKP